MFKSQADRPRLEKGNKHSWRGLVVCGSHLVDRLWHYDPEMRSLRLLDVSICFSSATASSSDGWMGAVPWLRQPWLSIGLGGGASIYSSMNSHTSSPISFHRHSTATVSTLHLTLPVYMSNMYQDVGDVPADNLQRHPSRYLYYHEHRTSAIRLFPTLRSYIPRPLNILLHPRTFAATGIAGHSRSL